MILFRRLFLVLSIVVAGSLTLAAAAIASGGGGGLPPGNYVFTDTNALAEFGTPIAQNQAPQFVISVDRSHSDFRPTAGPHVVTNTTDVNIQISTLTISGTGCFTIPASDFTVSPDLQTSALHTTLTTPCGSANAPLAGAKAVTPFAGSGGGGGGGLPASIRLDITWTGDGVVGTTRDANNFQCAGGTINRILLGRAAGVTASGTVSLPTGTLLPLSPADQGVGLRATQTFMNITGVQLSECSGLQTI